MTNRILTASIDGKVAREANIAVIYRSGPRRITQMLTWDFNTDQVVAGQWVKGRVFSTVCDVSPDGKYVVSALCNYSEAHEQRHRWTSGIQSRWTALSRPPYFSALAVWFHDSGGLWLNNRELLLHSRAFAPDKEILGRQIEFGWLSEDRQAPVQERLIALHGWEKTHSRYTELVNPECFDYWDQLDEYWKGKRQFSAEQLAEVAKKARPDHQLIQPETWVRKFSNGQIVISKLSETDTYEIQDADLVTRRKIEVPCGSVQWVDVAANGDPVFGDAGCLWRWRSFPDGEPIQVADLNPHQFVAVEPPKWALEW